MTAISNEVRNVAWNTAVTFGVATVSGAAAGAISKTTHRYFRIWEDLNNNSSLAVRAGAAGVGIMAAYRLSSRIELASVPLGLPFYKFYSFHLLFGTLFLAKGAALKFKKTHPAALIFDSVGTLLLFSSCAALGNRAFLLAAGSVGAINILRL